MATAKITKRSVDALKPGDRDAYLWDSGLAGFGIKCTPTGHMVYLVQYRTGGRRTPTRRITLGRHGTLTPDQARQAAEKVLASVKLGSDPAAEKAQKHEEGTIAELADRYLEEHAATHNRPSMVETVQRLVRAHIKPALGHVKVSELTRSQVKAWHHSLRKTPYEANRSLACLSKMLDLACKDWELRSDNPCAGVRRYPEKKRDSYYTDAELRRIGETLAEAERTGAELPGVVNTVRLLALTGCRLGEVRNLKWTDIDLESGAIHLPEAKTGSRTLTIGAAAMVLLAGLGQAGEYVFFDTDPAEPLTHGQMQNAWRRLRVKADVPNGRMHDFRHTTGTYAAQAGYNAFMVRDLLGHKSMAMTGRYVEKATAPLKAAADAVAGRVAAAMNNSSPAKVVELPKRKA